GAAGGRSAAQAASANAKPAARRKAGKPAARRKAGKPAARREAGVAAQIARAPDLLVMGWRRSVSGDAAMSTRSGDPRGGGWAMRPADGRPCTPRRPPPRRRGPRPRSGRSLLRRRPGPPRGAPLDGRGGRAAVGLAGPGG